MIMPFDFFCIKVIIDQLIRQLPDKRHRTNNVFNHINERFDQTLYHLYVIEIQTREKLR